MLDQAKSYWPTRRRSVAEHLDLRFRRKDGADLWIIGSSNPDYDENGRFAGALVIVADIVIGLILGPLAERHFRRALSISQGDPTVFFSSPLAATLLALAALALLGPMIWRWRAARATAGSGGR